MCNSDSLVWGVVRDGKHLPIGSYPLCFLCWVVIQIFISEQSKLWLSCPCQAVIDHWEIIRKIDNQTRDLEISFQGEAQEFTGLLPICVSSAVWDSRMAMLILAYQRTFYFLGKISFLNLTTKHHNFTCVNYTVSLVLFVLHLHKIKN